MFEKRKMKRIQVALCIVSQFTFSDLAFADLFKQYTDPIVCEKIGNREGIFYVYSDVRVKNRVQPVHFGWQHLRLRQEGRLYFVVGEEDGRAETVDHYRLLSWYDRPPAEANPQVYLDRNPVNTSCAGWLGQIFSDNASEIHSRTTIDNYDDRRIPENANIDNNLNSWHFDWNNGTRAVQDCQHTYEFVPAIQNDHPLPRKSRLLGGIRPSKSLISLDNPDAIEMLMIHRQENKFSCLGVRLGFDRLPLKTKINRLRFNLRGQKFVGPGTTIEWDD